ncbi:MAG: hypothetical protein CSA75_00270 [Sorangium cellulosum]|nr:MAG: hypothetical protein CSA75_00270 [Sorangium cellulosum]
MRIVFVGLPLAALLLIADGQKVVLAGLRKGLTTGSRRLQRSIGHGRVVVDPHRDWNSFRHRLEELRADLLVSWFFTRQIPMSVIDACPRGGIGVHPSLLPRHRGPDPFFAAIDAGDRETGVSVHRLAESYDTGAIVAQRRIAIDSSWNAWKLARMLDRPSLALLRQVVRQAREGAPLTGFVQNESEATQAAFPTEKDRLPDWTWPADAIVRRIRALSPNPGALVFSGDAALIVTKAEVRSVHDVLRPGEVGIMDGVAVVRAADQGVALLQAEVGGCRWGPEAIAHQITRSRRK